MTYSVTKDGKPLDPSLYNWDEKTKTFTTAESGLVLDFRGYSGVTFTTGSYCTFKTGSICTFTTGYGCTFKTYSSCTFKTGSACTFTTGSSCTFDTGYSCTFTTGYGCTFKTYSSCTFKTGSACMFKTGSYCTFKTGSSCTFSTSNNCTFTTSYGCTFNTGYGCTFKTGPGCTFTTGSSCTFSTSNNCTFSTSYDCTFTTDSRCIIVRQDEFEVIQPAEGEVIQLCPYNIPGYISKLPGEEAFYKEIDGQRAEHIIADGILSRVVKKRGNVYHVVNHSEDKVTYLVKDGDLYAHGETLEEARDDLKFKINGYDTSKYNDFTLDTELTLEEAIEMYRKITRACAKGTKLFVNHVLSPERKASKKKYTVKEVIELTKHQWNHDRLVEFFKGENNE